MFAKKDIFGLFAKKKHLIISVLIIMFFANFFAKILNSKIHNFKELGIYSRKKKR